MPLANYTTSVSAQESIADIQKLLVSFGAKSISMHYADGRPSGIEFSLMLEKAALSFQLPVNAEACRNALLAAK